MKKIGISTDCMCDLPADYLTANGIEVMQFYVHTATGRFWTESEITSGNIVEYFEAGNAFLRSTVPEPEECRAYFEELLKRYDEVIHITTSGKIGMSFPNAEAALELMGERAKRVRLVSSDSLSAGLGHTVRQAVALRDGGASAEALAQACGAMGRQLSASVIMTSADYLYRAGYAGQLLKDLCSLFKIRPVLCTKDGRLALKTFYVGSYEGAVMRYVRKAFKRRGRIDKRQLFITHAGCPAELLARVRTKADSLCSFDEITVTRASAFISSCFGPKAVGVLFVYR